jgi:TatD DNase family protein
MDALFDSHGHLQLPAFDRDREGVLERARAAGVTGNVVVGIDGDSSRRAVALAARHSDVYAAVGFHPHEAKSLDEQALRLLRELARAPGVVAIGEIGLDFYRNLSPREAQERAFREQLALAAELGLPVIIHSRQAEGETLEIVERWARHNDSPRRPPGVLHCFAGSAATAERYMHMGFFISVAGNVTYRNAGDLRSVVAGVPLERLMVETDCPFLAPQSRRGKRSEPADVAETARAVADAKGIPYGEVARATTENARLLFRIQVGEPAKETRERA